MSALVSRWEEFCATQIRMERLLVRVERRCRSYFESCLIAATAGRCLPLLDGELADEAKSVVFSRILSGTHAAPLPADLLTGDALVRLLPPKIVSQLQNDWGVRKIVRRMAYDLAIQAVADFLEIQIPFGMTASPGSDVPELLDGGRARIELTDLATEALDILGCTVHRLTPEDLALAAQYETDDGEHFIEDEPKTE